MQLVAIIGAHNNSKVLFDTIQSFRFCVTPDIVLVVDGFGWEEFDENYPAFLLKGFRHGYYKSPYRNLALGLYQSAIRFPNADWYIYAEYDCLAASSDFLIDLQNVSEDCFCLGANFRYSKKKFPFLETIIKDKIKESRYLLGCLVFYRGSFIRRLLVEDFFERFLFYTNSFSQDYFPGYTGYDFSEHLYPTLATHYGGKIGGLVWWNEKTSVWEGNFSRYRLRWQPELDFFAGASFYHPLKSFHHPIRNLYREIRNGKHRL